MENDPQEAARQALRLWRRRADTAAVTRDPAVLHAVKAGLSKEEVHVLTGLGRATIDRILKAASEGETSEPAR